MHCAGEIPFKTGFIIDRNQNNGKFVTSNCLQIDQNQNRGKNFTIVDTWQESDHGLNWGDHSVG